MSRRHPLLRLASAVALAALLLSALTVPVAADDTIQVSVRALVGGRFEAGGWAALAVSLANDGAPVSGYVSAESEDGVVRRFVELPGGSRKQVALYLRPAAFARTVAVSFTDVNGNLLGQASVEVRVLERTTGHVAVVGDPQGMLRPQLISRGEGFPDPILLTASDLPERPEALRGVETMVWATDSSGISEAQLRALERWIAAGGQLVVLGGPDWQARIAGLEHLLPVQSLRGVDDTALAPLATWAGSALPTGVTVATAALGSATGGSIVLARTESDDVMAAAHGFGAGRVSWLAVDLATDAFRAWPGAPFVWARLVPDDRLLQQYGGGGVPEEELASYILLIGPISYVRLRRFDRRELAWITAPALVLVFSGTSYGIGYAMKGSDVIVNQVAVVRTAAEGGAASVSTFAGIFSPTRATYDLTVEADALLSALQLIGFEPTVSTGSFVTEQGDPAHLRGLAVSVFGLQAVRAEAVIAYTPSLAIDWSSGTSGIEGRVTNSGQATMEDVALIHRGGGLMIGTLAAGESKTFLLSTNSTGASAADQVYGFVNWDTVNDEQRTRLMRRQVIDALVGYGGFVGRPDTTFGIDRGPFLIGWQRDAAPVQVTVDGQTPQQFTQMVEVVSGRPRLGPGPVRLSASQLNNEVIELAGEASQGEPGFVTLANGEVTFRVSTPLEATGLVPTKVTLIAGNDPGVIFYDQENLGGFLPAGYRMAAYDVVDGAWVDVGDLSLTSRFEVDDPTRVIDGAGRILLRISGTGIGPEVGQIPVFASAILEGVIDR